MEEKEKRYKIEKIKKIDEIISAEEKLKIMHTIFATVYAAASVLMFKWGTNVDSVQVVRALCRIMCTVFGCESLYNVYGGLEAVLEKTALGKEKFDLECDLHAARNEDECQRAEEEAFRK